jgi:hypothetical protein
VTKNRSPAIGAAENRSIAPGAESRPRPAEAHRPDIDPIDRDELAVFGEPAL